MKNYRFSIITIIIATITINLNMSAQKLNNEIDSVSYSLGVNIGENINSSAPEFAPCISLDGKSMVFTSRRPDTKGGMVDVNYDHIYYSDIY